MNRKDSPFEVKTVQPMSEVETAQLMSESEEG